MERRLGGFETAVLREVLAAVDEVSAPVFVAVGVAERRADEHVVVLVAGHVAGPGRRDRPSGAVAVVLAGESHVGVAEVQFARQVAAVDDVGGTGGRASAVVERRADDHVADSVAVHVAGVGERPSGQVAGRLAAHLDGCVRERGLAVGLDHGVGGTGVGGGAVVERRADEDVSGSVAVHVATVRDGLTSAVAGRLAAHRRVGVSRREHHVAVDLEGVCGTGVLSGPVVTRRADRDGVSAVVVRVDRGDREAELVAGLGTGEFHVGVGEVHRPRHVRRAVDDVHRSGVVGGVVVQRRADDQVAIAVAVDVARRDAVSGPVTGALAPERQVGVSGVVLAVLDGTGEEVRRPASGVCAVVKRRADEHVVVTVPIYVAGGSDRRSESVVSAVASYRHIGIREVCFSGECSTLLLLYVVLSGDAGVRTVVAVAGYRADRTDSDRDRAQRDQRCENDCASPFVCICHWYSSISWRQFRAPLL